MHRVRFRSTCTHLNVLKEEHLKVQLLPLRKHIACYKYVSDIFRGILKCRGMSS
jgi:hypothetical protein